MKSLVIAGVMAGVLLGSINVYAEQNKTDSKKHDQHAREMPALTDMTLTGKIVKEEMARKGKDGKEITMTKFVLRTADGDVFLAPSKDLDLSAYADKNVTIEGQGFAKNDKKMLKKIVKISEAAPAAE